MHVLSDKILCNWNRIDMSDVIAYIVSLLS